jgi:hypothetical protein
LGSTMHELSFNPCNSCKRTKNLDSDVNDARCIASSAKKQQHRILLDLKVKFEKFQIPMK